jgi:hypothetical protein
MTQWEFQQTARVSISGAQSFALSAMMALRWAHEILHHGNCPTVAKAGGGGGGDGADGE